MTVEPGYPVTLVHPLHMPAKVIIGDAPAEPERFPSVTVNGADSEAQYRAQGYLRYGEPLPITDYHEYPKILRHADYRAEIPSRVEAKIEDGKIVPYTIPAVPAHMPDVIVKNKKEENVWTKKGYAPAGDYNHDALESVLASPKPGDVYHPDEYPKWIDGKLVLRDPDAPEELLPSDQYPRWENGVLIHDPRFPQAPDPHLYPMWVHKDGIPSDESVLVENPKEEYEARKKFAPVETIALEPKAPFEIKESQLEGYETLASNKKKLSNRAA